MRVTRVINASSDQLEKAKQTAIQLVGVADTKSAVDLFFTENLDEIETGIKKLNDFSSKAWLMSAMLLYSLIYDKGMYKQSGLTWREYSQAARERLGMDNRDITEQLSAARFFIMHNQTLVNHGFDPASSSFRLARAELALTLCGSVEQTVEHIINDSNSEFKAWYQSYKPAKAIPQETANARKDIKTDGFYIGDVQAVTINDALSESDHARLEKYIRAIFEALRKGYEPAIIPVYDEREAKIMPKLRDKNRRGK